MSGLFRNLLCFRQTILPSASSGCTIGHLSFIQLLTSGIGIPISLYRFRTSSSQRFRDKIIKSEQFLPVTRVCFRFLCNDQRKSDLSEHVQMVAFSVRLLLFVWNPHSFINSFDNHSTAPGPASCRRRKPPGNAVSGYSSTMCLVTHGRQHGVPALPDAGRASLLHSPK